MIQIRVQAEPNGNKIMLQNFKKNQVLHCICLRHFVEFESTVIFNDILMNINCTIIIHTIILKSALLADYVKSCLMWKLT